jgi:endonuclease/exonuclease/phosphatase family metal-dependent hydrolase
VLRASWLLLLLGCATAAPRSPTTVAAPEARAEPTAVVVPEPASVEVRLATVNIQVLGPTKAAKPEVMVTLAAVIRRYDLVAVQEIKDISGRAPPALLEACNADGPEYALALSERTGREPDDRQSQEQYAYYYRRDRLEPVGEGVLYDDSAVEHFQREPFLQQFRVVGTERTFVMLNVHTRPRAAVSEIAAMEHVFAWAKTRYGANATVIAVGDFHAGCGYASEEELDALPIHGEALRLGGPALGGHEPGREHVPLRPDRRRRPGGHGPGGRVGCRPRLRGSQRLRSLAGLGELTLRSLAFQAHQGVSTRALEPGTVRVTLPSPGTVTSPPPIRLLSVRPPGPRPLRSTARWRRRSRG